MLSTREVAERLGITRTRVMQMDDVLSPTFTPLPNGCRRRRHYDPAIVAAVARERSLVGAAKLNSKLTIAQLADEHEDES